MESFSKRRKLFIRNICACCTIAAIMLYGCGGSNSSSADQKKQYGTVSLGLQFERNSAHNLSMDNGRSVAGPNICEDFNIDVVDVQIFWPDGQSVVAISWACSDHQGTIRQVPVGSDFSLSVRELSMASLNGGERSDRLPYWRVKLPRSTRLPCAIWGPIIHLRSYFTPFRQQEQRMLP